MHNSLKCSFTLFVLASFPGSLNCLGPKAGPFFSINFAFYSLFSPSKVGGGLRLSLLPSPSCDSPQSILSPPFCDFLKCF